MTDEEFMRRVNRDFDYRTLNGRATLWLIVVVGIASLVLYLVTTP